MTREEAIETLKANYPDACYEQLREAVDAAIEALKAQGVAGDTIYRQTAIDAMYKILHDYFWANDEELDAIIATLNDLPSAQPEIIRCKDCEFGEQDEVGRWFCRSLGCQIGNEDGSGFCADAERRTDE